MRAADRSRVEHCPATPGAAHKLVADLNREWKERGWQVALYGSLATGAPIGGDIDLVAFAITFDPEPFANLVNDLRDKRGWEVLDMYRSLMSDSYTFRTHRRGQYVDGGVAGYLVDLSFRKSNAG